jgi:hypothetical protein
LGEFEGEICVVVGVRVILGSNLGVGVRVILIGLFPCKTLRVQVSG